MVAPICRRISATRAARVRRLEHAFAPLGSLRENAAGTDPPSSLTTFASESHASESIIVGSAWAAAGHEALSRAATSASSASAHAAVAAICAKNAPRCASLEQMLLRISRSSLSTEMTSAIEPYRCSSCAGAAAGRMAIVIAHASRCVVDRLAVASVRGDLDRRRSPHGHARAGRENHE